MHKATFARLLFTISAIGAVGVWVACGGSDDQDVVQSDAGTDSGDKDTGDNEPEDSGRDTGPADTGPKDSGKVYDAGQPNVLPDDSGVFEAGIPCYLGGEVEEEPNDQIDAANILRPTRCGYVLVDPDGGPDGGEDDWYTFYLGDASTTFFVKYEGNVKVYVETDGMAPADITATPPPNLIFRRDQPYFVRVRSASGNTQLYKVILFEE